MSTYQFLLLLLRLAGMVVMGLGAEQRFAMEPQDQTAVVGSRVTLPCRVEHKTGTLQWTKDDFGLGTHRNLSGFDRYSMVGSDEEGDFSLDIYPLMLEDDARYQCQVSPGPQGQPGIRSHFATVTVLVPPDRPKILQGDHLITTEDREIELECISFGGKPASEITWIDGSGNVLTHGIENIVNELPDGKRFTVKSILKLTPRKDHHNTTFTCQAQNTAERTHRSAKLKLEVKYAPKVAVSILSGAAPNGRIPEGAEIRIGCHADANPPEMSYRWYLNDQQLIGDYTTELILHNVTRKHHDALVKCEVVNPVGKSEESETLDISYGPHFRTKPRSVESDIDATITLSCEVDGNPTPDVAWIHEESNRLVSSSPNLTVRVDKDTAGRYYCRAVVPGFPEIGAHSAIYLKGPPSIISHQTQFGIEGDNVRVECTAYSIPKARKVVWAFNGREVDLHDQDYSILEDPLEEGIKSTLIIRESQEKHFGTYNCTVVNDYGTDTVDINLKPQKNFPFIYVIIGSLVVVIVLALFAVIIFLCQRRGHKKQPPEMDANAIEKQCKESDRSSNISDLKVDLRTGSSVSNVHCDDYVPGAESETGSESVITRIGVPLAGPVNLPGQEYCRYSEDYPEPIFPPKDGMNNNGYVPYVDYARDYTPPMMQPPLSSMEPSRESLQSTRLQLSSLQLQQQQQHSPSSTTTLALTDLTELHQSLPNGSAGTIDPRFSATYGNPYLRTPNLGLPIHTPNTANPAATPAPPPYTRDSLRNVANASNGSLPQVSRLPNSPTTQYIVPPSAVKRGTMATHV